MMTANMNHADKCYKMVEIIKVESLFVLLSKRQIQTYSLFVQSTCIK